MKIVKSFMAACLSFALVAATPAMLVTAPVILVGCTGGCASNDAVSKISGTAKVSADAAMRTWGQYVKQFHPPAEQEQAVKDAFEKYQAAQVLMLNAAIAYREAEAAGGDKTAAQAKLDSATAGISAALGDLVTLLTKFGVKF